MVTNMPESAEDKLRTIPDITSSNIALCSTESVLSIINKKGFEPKNSAFFPREKSSIIYPKILKKSAPIPRYKI
jgi:hypothetical protein